jgi:hypothetical protein
VRDPASDIENSLKERVNEGAITTTVSSNDQANQEARDVK